MYFLAKKRLRNRGLLVKPDEQVLEEPVSEPSTPTETVDYSATLNEYKFITPGQKEKAPRETSPDFVPTEPQVVGVQANIRGPIVVPTPASKPESPTINPIPQSATSPKRTGQKAFSVVITLLFISALGVAIWSQVALKQVNEALDKASAEIYRQELNNAALRKAVEDARADQIAAEKEIDELEEKLTNAIFNEMEYYFALKQIGFIYQGYKNYHFYGCELAESATHFTAHNIEYCKYLGYDPCPNCWDK